MFEEKKMSLNLEPMPKLVRIESSLWNDLKWLILIIIAIAGQNAVLVSWQELGESAVATNWINVGVWIGIVVLIYLYRWYNRY